MNALSNETSPYLLQHATNPVDWHPWGADALAVAATENKPILLSIGYSACHWCHVMAHESFENNETAALMNAHFINIKVDREERPDIDKIYQSAQYLLTQSQGGWPLTLFLTPDDQIPFAGGTYFPNEARHGLPAFVDLLQRVADAYRERENDIRTQNAQVLEALNSIQAPNTDAKVSLDDGPLRLAREQAARAFDQHLGGFGRAPKFPHPGGLERLLRDHARSNGDDEHAQHMALFTLSKMARGGIYDHLGGGFCRYSVDNQWLIPHFEKMLYDNGPLLDAYAQAWQVNRDPLFASVVEETATFIRREMTAPDGGFYSSLDADTQGEEGKYYVWDPAEISSILGDDYEVFVRRYGLRGKPNFEGRYHLRIAAEFHEISNVTDLDVASIEASVTRARAQLLSSREQRERPARDEKILVSWNALMIKGFAVSGRIFANDDYIDSAASAIDFLRNHLWRDGQLLATYKDGKAHLNAYLDDYAFLLDALINMLASRWRSEDLDFALALAECLLEQFQDEDNGGFFFTSHNHESLIQRTKVFTDDAMPAGNGVAAWSLARLGHLLGEERYLHAAERTLQAAWPALEETPAAHNAMLLALEEALDPPTIVILRGDALELSAWQRELNQQFAPTRLSFAIPRAENDLPGVLSDRAAASGVIAYLCRGSHCLAPMTSLKTLLQELDATSVADGS